MKLNCSRTRTRRTGGVSLLECLVYLAIFTVVLGVGTAAFYAFWDNSIVLRHTTDDIAGALRAGETWRAEIRGATGKIETQTSSDGMLVKIPQRAGDVYYRFDTNTLWRWTPAAKSWTPVLQRVKSSQMEMENRGGIQAWNWELALTPFHSRAKTPLAFSFEAVAPKSP